MGDSEKGETPQKSIPANAANDRRSVSVSSRRRGSVNPQIEVLKRRREELHRKHPEVAEAERLRREIERLEKDSKREAQREEDEKNLELKRVQSMMEVKFITRPKIRAYFQRSRLFRRRGDNECAATASISLFTDLLFVGILAETGGLAVQDSNTINLVRFVVQFLPTWRIWCYIRDIVAMYEMNAVSQRLLTQQWDITQY